jgi:hypothetical protein
MDPKKAQLVALDFHRRKLVTLVGEMLEKADELDHASQAKKKRLPVEWDQALASACRDLSTLNQAVQGIEELVEKSNIKDTQESLLRCTDIANHLSKRLNELKRKLDEC